MRPIPFDPKVQARRERAAQAARWAELASCKPDTLLRDASVVAVGAFVFLLVVML